MKKIVREPKWSGQSKRDRVRERKWKQRDTASEESKAKEKESDRFRKKRCIQGESRVALYLAHFLKLFRPPLCHLHRYLHVVTTDIYLHISGYPSARGILCACVFLVIYCGTLHTLLQYTIVYYCSLLWYTTVVYCGILYLNDISNGSWTFNIRAANSLVFDCHCCTNSFLTNQINDDPVL